MHIIYYVDQHGRGNFIRLPAANYAGDGWKCSESVWLVPGTWEEGT